MGKARLFYDIQKRVPCLKPAPQTGIEYQRSMCASLSTVLSYDYKSKQVIAASAPSRLHNGSKLPPLESFDTPGQYAYANAGQAQRSGLMDDQTAQNA